MRIFCLNESSVHCSRFLWNTLRCKNGAKILPIIIIVNSCICHFFVPLSCRLNCSMFTDDEGSDEDLDDNCSVENERYFLFHVRFLPQNNNINLEDH